MCDPVDQRETLAEQGRLGRLGGIKGAPPEPVPYAVYVPFTEYQRLLKLDADLKNAHLAVHDLTQKLQFKANEAQIYKEALHAIHRAVDEVLL